MTTAPAVTEQTATRVVAVLGYSDAGSEGLHSVCASRVEHAAREARPDDLVVLSGWARRRGRLSEAQLMLRAWPGPVERVVCDDGARTTAENAAHVVALARSAGASEIVIVTSRWHALRAATFFRLLLRGTDVDVTVSFPPEPRSVRGLARELVRWPLVPLQAVLARRVL